MVSPKTRDKWLKVSHDAGSALIHDVTCTVLTAYRRLLSTAEPHPPSARAGSGCKPELQAYASFVQLECNYHAYDYITFHEYRYLTTLELG